MKQRGQLGSAGRHLSYIDSSRPRAQAVVVVSAIISTLMCRFLQDADQCSAACIQFQCRAVNVFQLGEYEFMCEILGTVVNMVPAQGSACYAPVMSVYNPYY